MKPLKWYRSLSSSKERRESGVFLIEGPRAVEQIHQSSPAHVLEILVADHQEPSWGIPVRRLTRAQFEMVVPSKTPQGIAAVVQIPDNSNSAQLPDEPGDRLLILENVQDPGNVGTLIRTAAAFDFAGVILNDGCADPFSPKAAQASAGALLSLWIRRCDRYMELARALRERGTRIVAGDVRGEPCGCGSLRQRPLAIALGSEGTGLTAKMLAASDIRCRIPFNSARVESLNVAVAGAILMAFTAQ